MSNRQSGWMLCWLLLLAAAPGCYTLGIMQDAKLVRPGTVRASLGMGFNERLVPSQHLGVRVGLVPHIEARAKVSFGSSQIIQSAQAGFNLEAPTGKHKSVLFMPYYRFDPEIFETKDSIWDSEYPRHTIHAFALPVLFVEYLGDDHFFLGPDLQVGTRDQRPFLGLGGHVGYAFALGRYVHLTPELGVLVALAGTPGPAPSWQPGPQTTLLPGGCIVELGFSFSFGAAHEAEGSGAARAGASRR